LKGKKTMGLRDMSSDTNSNREASNQRDFLRLIAKGKRPASQEKNKRPVGEDGQPLAKLQLLPEREFLPGGMPGGDRASTSGYVSPEVLARMSADEKIMWCMDGGLAKALGPDGDNASVPVIFGILKDGQIESLVRRGAAEGLGTIAAANNDSSIKSELLKILKDGQIGDWVRRGAAEGLGTIIKIRTKQQIENDMRARESRSTERSRRDAPATSSSEASSSRTRLPERGQGDRSGEGGSAQEDQLIDQMRKILEERSLMRERENKLKHEAEQRLQRELERVRREEQQKLQQERNRFQRQLGEAQQERNQAREERDQARGQLRDAQQELNQAQRQLRETQEMIQSLQGEENRRRAMWNRLYDAFWSLTDNTEREPQQDERGQSSRGGLRANDALPTTLEGMQEQLERERRTPQEARGRVQRLREHIQRSIWEQGNQPPNERLNELLKYPMEGVLEDHHLVEQIYPPEDQPAQDRQALRESFNKALRYRLRNLYLTIVTEYSPSGLGANEIAGEFLDQLQEQMEEHNRPSQEWIDASEDIQEEVTGRRPRR
jgi:hypothetical protein